MSSPFSSPAPHPVDESKNDQLRYEQEREELRRSGNRFALCALIAIPLLLAAFAIDLCIKPEYHTAFSWVCGILAAVLVWYFFIRKGNSQNESRDTPASTRPNKNDA